MPSAFVARAWRRPLTLVKIGTARVLGAAVVPYHKTPETAGDTQPDDV
ncbi:MAG: hypothetical protein M0Z95_05730 [Actinomycetota bacterium]|nr:hypothetical protein [Actinomycetota bacterium]